MVLKVSLETFNDAVRENMELLDLTEEEAREETINQFTAQGADLTVVVMQPSFCAVSNALQTITKILDKVIVSNADIKAELSIIRHEVDKDIAVRVHAASVGAYGILLRCMNALEKHNCWEAVCTMTSLMNGYPDLLDEEGVERMLSLLNENEAPLLIQHTLKWAKVSVIKHEGNRLKFEEKELRNYLGSIIFEYASEKEVIACLCQLVRAYTMDDDIRVVAGNAHGYAQGLACELLKPLTRLLPTHATDERMQYELIQTINVLIVRNELCISVYETDGVRFAMDAMVNFPDNQGLNRQCLLLFKGLAGSDEVKEPMMNCGIAPLIISVLNRHKKAASIVAAGCVCLSALTLRSPCNAKILADARAPETLVELMTAYQDNTSIQNKACTAIRNHVNRYSPVKEEYLQLGIEDLINQLKEKNGELDFEAKSVLKELGCEVELEEQWKGCGTHLSND